MDESYTKFPNRLMSALMSYGFNGTQHAVLYAVIRKTYGWGKPSDTISAAQIARMTGKRREVITRTISDLEKIGVLKIERPTKRRNEICVADPSEWERDVTNSSHVGCDKNVTYDVTNSSHKDVTNSSHTKEKERGRLSAGADSAPKESEGDEDYCDYEALLEEIMRMSL